VLRPPERERRRPDETAPRIPVTATSNEESILNSADPRRIGELLGAWLDVRMAEVDDLVAEARSKVEAIPNLRSLWLVIGELVVRLSAVELEVAELRKAARR
jgi:hypothetical protein